MSWRTALVPDARHPITITPASHSVTVSFAGRVVARSDRALVLQESTYRPVHYLPLEDVDPAVLEPTSHRTHCPYKGDASYYTLRAGDEVAENAVWSYVSPYDAVSEIAGRVAFYPQHVELTTS